MTGAYYTRYLLDIRYFKTACVIVNDIKENGKRERFSHPVCLLLQWLRWGLKVHLRRQSYSNGHGNSKISPQPSQIVQNVETLLESQCSHAASCLCQIHTVAHTEVHIHTFRD